VTSGPGGGPVGICVLARLAFVHRAVGCRGGLLCLTGIRAGCGDSDLP
jgi:hypothetical protein